MLKNYLIIAIRNIVRNKTYSFINIAGLAVGMAAFILIMLFVQQELSYDRFHIQKERIYGLSTVREAGEGAITSYAISAPLLPSLIREFPEIASFIRVDRLGKVSVTYQDQTFFEDQIILADSSFFQVFTFPLIQGNPNVVLSEKYSVVITEKIAAKYFGDEDPIGKYLTITRFGWWGNEKLDLLVTGVAKDAPYNTHLPFTLVAPFPLVNDNLGGKDFLANWGSINYEGYVLMKPDVSLDDFQRKSTIYYQQIHEDDRWSVVLQPITNIHLTRELKSNIFILTAIGLIIIAMAGINFINLSIAQSTIRLKEAGMRKVIGATRTQIMSQFFGESIVLSLLVLPAAIVLTEILLPLCNSLFNLHLNFYFFQQWQTLLGIVAMALIVGAISGAYPAWYISSKSPTSALKPSSMLNISGSRFRNILVVIQFSAAIALLAMTMIMHAQFNSIRLRDMGFSGENIINIRTYGEDPQWQLNVLKPELLKIPSISSISVNLFMIQAWNQYIQWEGMEGDERMSMRWSPADEDFLSTFQVELIAGRNFLSGDQEDAYLLNESAVNALGWELGTAVGKQFRVMDGGRLGKVVGIVRDFHFLSLHYPVIPLAFRMWPTPASQIETGRGVLSLKVQPDSIQQAISSIRSTMSDVSPLVPFEYYFIEEYINRMYSEEEQQRQVVSYSSGVSILIACLGLFGLAAFTASRRTKEIGIRKVVGASVTQVVTLLSKEFLILVLIANLIAWPIAWYAMSRWLENFAYRIDLGLGTFILAGLLTLVIALATVSYQAVKAATANPVDALRYE